MKRRLILYAAAASILISSTSVGVMAADKAQSLTAVLGLLSYLDDGGEAIYSLYLQPDFALGKLGVGLDLRVNVDTTGNFTFPDSMLDSVRYLRYGYKGSPLYFRVGNLEGSSLGSGLLVDNYTNLTLAETQVGGKRLGLALDLNTQKFGVETLYKNSPLLGQDEEGLQAYRAYFTVAPNLQLGYSYVQDNSALFTAGGSGLRAISADAEYHISRNKLVPYIAGARFLDKGNGEESGYGYSAGVRGTIGSSVAMFDYKAELRLLASDFTPGLFNFAYETERTSDVLAALPADGDRQIGLMGAAKLEFPAIDLKVIGQIESHQPYSGDLSQVFALEPKVVAEATLGAKAVAAKSAGLSASARYEAIWDADDDDLGKLKMTVTYKTPVGLKLSVYSIATYTKGQEPEKTFGVEGGFSF